MPGEYCGGKHKNMKKRFLGKSGLEARRFGKLPMTKAYPTLTLSNGVAMPALGLGVYRSSPEETLFAVSTALDTGYRLIDTAAAYGNEARGRRGASAAAASTAKRCSSRPSSGSATTAMTRRCTASTQHAQARSRAARPLLLHQPMPTDWDRTVAAWKAPSAACRRADPRHWRVELQLRASRPT